MLCSITAKESLECVFSISIPLITFKNLQQELQAQVKAGFLLN